MGNRRETEGGKRDLRVFRGDGERVAWEEKGLGNRRNICPPSINYFLNFVPHLVRTFLHSNYPNNNIKTHTSAFIEQLI